MAGYKRHVLAKALYDNFAEAPDELAFRKGDVVTVLEQNTGGLEGWWLCSLNGRQGIAPGNRLKLLVGMYDSSQNLHGGSPQKALSSNGLSPGFQSPGARRSSADTPGRSEQEDYDIPRPSPHALARKSSPDVSLGYHTMPSARKPPSAARKLQKQTSQETYDVPGKQYGNPQENYDVPGKQYGNPQENYDVPVKQYGNPEENYDVPVKQYGNPQENYDVPVKQYGNPQENYEVPIKQYGNPQENYDVPGKQYGNPEENYDVPPMANHWASPTKQQYHTSPRKTQSANTSPTHSLHLVTRVSPDISELYDTPPKYNGGNQSPTEVYDVPPSCMLPMKKSAIAKDISDDYDIPVPSPESQLPIDTYDVPPKALNRQSPTDVYDVPISPRIATDLYNSPRIPPGSTPNDGPRIPPEGYMHDTLKKTGYGGGGDEQTSGPLSPGYCKMKAVPKFFVTKDKIADSKIDSVTETDSVSTPVADSDYVYDIPPQVTQDKPSSSNGGTGTLKRHQSLDEVDKLSAEQVEGQRSKSFDMGTLRRVLFERDTAMDLMVKRQQVLETAISYMLSYVSSVWRHQANLQARIHEIKAACNQLKLALMEFLEFAKDTVTFAARSTDTSIQTELGISLQPLQESYAKLLRASLTLDKVKWSVDKLKHTPSLNSNTPSELDQYATTAKSLTKDMKRFVTFVETHCEILFKGSEQRSMSVGQQGRPLPTPPGSKSPDKSFTWMTAEKEGTLSPAHVQTRPLPHVPEHPTPPEQTTKMNTNQTVGKKGGDYGFITKPTTDIKSSTNKIIVTDDSNHNVSYISDLLPNDKEIITFYQEEVEGICNETISAADSFFTCVEAKQPPKVFVSHSKRIILLGHKLVFIGDTLHHNLSQTEFRARVIHMSDLLCDCLNIGVNATKTAALQYPAVQPIQEMVDRITDIANATQDLKLSILVASTT